MRTRASVNTEQILRNDFITVCYCYDLFKYFTEPLCTDNVHKQSNGLFTYLFTYLFIYLLTYLLTYLVICWCSGRGENNYHGSSASGRCYYLHSCVHHLSEYERLISGGNISFSDSALAEACR